MDFLVKYFSEFSYHQAIDIVLVLLLIYQLYRFLKGTIAIKIFLGFIGIYAFWKAFEFFELKLISEITGQILSIAVIVLVVVFQPELRRFLMLIGTTGLKDLPLAKRLLKVEKAKTTKHAIDINSIIQALELMAKTQTGALIVILKKNDISLMIAGGDEIDAKLSSRLLKSIFFKNSPLHDGAVIIKNNRI